MADHDPSLTHCERTPACTLDSGAEPSELNRSLSFFESKRRYCISYTKKRARPSQAPRFFPSFCFFVLFRISNLSAFLFHLNLLYEINSLNSHIFSYVSAPLVRGSISMKIRILQFRKTSISFVPSCDLECVKTFPSLHP